MQIRREQESDFDQVYALNARAFGSEDESKLIEKLRSADGYISFVAVEDDKVLGHISFSPLTLDGRPTAFAGLAPMSVLPEYQKRGIGSKLVKAGLESCRNAGRTAVFVLGHADYYPRFGFQTADPLGFSSIYPVPPEHFMVLELEEGSLGGMSGLIKYLPAFDEL